MCARGFRMEAGVQSSKNVHDLSKIEHAATTRKGGQVRGPDYAAQKAVRRCGDKAALSIAPKITRKRAGAMPAPRRRCRDG